MSERTNIEYADSTCNVLVGCAGCELWSRSMEKPQCYAAALVGRHAGLQGWPRRFDEPELYPHRLEAALRWKDLRGTKRPDKPWLDGMPRVVFLNDLGDTFTPGSPVPVQEWFASMLERMGNSPHVWLILTKQAKRMREFFDEHKCPENVWPGVTVTKQARTWRVAELVQIEARVRWLSCEPLLEALDLRRWLQPIGYHCASGDGEAEAEVEDSLIDWVAVGGASGPNGAPCDVANIRDVIQQCTDSSVGHEMGLPCFVKQVGSDPVLEPGPISLTCADPKGGDWTEWPADLRVRMMPTP